MAAAANEAFTGRGLAAAAAPFAVILLAGAVVRSPIAAAHPAAALMLFLWAVADTMMVARMARSPGLPSRDTVLGVLAGASVTVWLASPPALRDVLRAMPAIAAGMAIVVLAHLAWAAVRARRALITAELREDRWLAAAGEFVPPVLARLAAAEIAVIRMALFCWGGPPDVPANSRAFAYHRHLAPMCATLLALSAIEIAVYHLLVGHWSRTAGIVMFVFSDIGFIYLVGLIKSFRFRPILLTPEGIRIRAGFLIDQFVPLTAIADIEASIAGEQVRDPATLNAALLAWPNVLLRLEQPMPRGSFLKKRKAFSSVAFRLDDPEPFVRLLRWRLGRPT